MSSSGSEKGSSKDRQRSRSKGKSQTNKLFVTDLDGTAKIEDLKDELTKIFSEYGTIEDCTVKKSKNSDYHFAFIVYKDGSDGDNAVKKLNGVTVLGRAMKVDFQNDEKRRKDTEKGCYNCGKKGHFARECRSARTSSNGGYRRDRSRSRSSSDERSKKRRRRSPSESSERHHRKKERKHGSKDKKDKKSSKKHKKSRRASSSDSKS